MREKNLSLLLCTVMIIGITSSCKVVKVQGESVDLDSVFTENSSDTIKSEEQIPSIVETPAPETTTINTITTTITTSINTTPIAITTTTTTPPSKTTTEIATATPAPITPVPKRTETL